MTVLIVKQITEKLLADTYVHGEYLDMHASDVFWALCARYLKGTPVELDFPQMFRDPVVTSRFPGIPLRVALEDICRYCGIVFRVTDLGAIHLSLSARKTEALKHRVEIWPDPTTWQYVVPKVVEDGI